MGLWGCADRGLSPTHLREYCLSFQAEAANPLRFYHMTGKVFGCAKKDFRLAAFYGGPAPMAKRHADWMLIRCSCCFGMAIPTPLRQRRCGSL